jgi:UDP-N-acetylglucosamine:LPS N-acetylglucosamine transferase
MPLLQIPSGHHHVADSIEAQLNQSPGDFHCEKVELLSYSYGNIETLVSSIYLQWIHKIPRLYSQIYKHAAVNGEEASKHFFIYELLFLKKVQKLIQQTKPDLIICTHALPSYILERLKRKNYWSGLVINVYTDYFVNNLWGIEGINYHFVPSLHVQEELILRGIKSHQTFVTGIPIHPQFKVRKNKHINHDRYTILISGGNMGAGSVHQLLKRLKPSRFIHYQVLCGKNEKLFQYIKHLNHSHIRPIAYLSSKETMNQLYEEVDAIITKPGGITITESLCKKLPILVYEALPGQEEINLQYLKAQGLIFHLENWDSSMNLEEVIINILRNDISQFNQRVDAFYDSFDQKDISKIIKELLMP